MLRDNLNPKCIALINEIANECIENMSDDYKRHLRLHPNPDNYHFSLGLYIRNKYRERFHQEIMDWYWDDDSISTEILCRIIRVLLPEYDCIPEIYEALDYEDVIRQLHCMYLSQYNHCPVDILKANYHLLLEVKDYKEQHDVYPCEYKALQTKEERDEYRKTNEEKLNKSRDEYFSAIENLRYKYNLETVELFWNFTLLYDQALKLGIPDSVVNEFHDYCLDALKNNVLIPSSFLLTYSFSKLAKKVIKNIIINCKFYFYTDIDSRAKLLPKWLFSIREFAEIIIKENGFLLKYVNDFSDDYDIVKLAVSVSPSSIKFASKRLQNNRDIINAAAVANGK